ncbi:MAG: hypothetical protein IT319_11815 [Anaerolineae bacterium]|nr:hypothetical protein [Anaerolineae bacterium]
MKTVRQLDSNTRHWFDAALQWADPRWNPDHHLLQMPLDRRHHGKVEAPYIIRDSVWYAVGLLMRQEPGDAARAQSTLEAVLNFQYDEPAAVYHGTFKRHHQELHPPADAVVWRDYDPNWREFIGTVFIILLKDFGELLPVELQDRMRYSIRLAAEGAFERKVAAEYTNISLMSAFLLDYAGEIYANSVWRDYARTLAGEIHALYNRYQTFNEYNSPTYYGVDFYALALWREYGSSPLYRDLGSSMEAGLWRDLAQFYHAGMRNICGPYDRSYGMDMTDYLALLGLWIAAVVPPTHAPLPDVHRHFEHAADFFFMPLVALVGSKPPGDVLPALTTFQGERNAARTIEPNRTVTAWLSEGLMLGAEADHLNQTRTDQFHPATAHWQTPDGAVCWLRTRCETLIQAFAEPRRLQLSSREPVAFVFEIRAPGADATLIHADQWRLPGLNIRLDRPDTPFTAEQDGGVIRVRFEASEPITLTFST